MAERVYGLDADSIETLRKMRGLVFGGHASNMPMPRRRRLIAGGGQALREGRAKDYILPAQYGRVYFGEEPGQDVDLLPTFKNQTSQVIWSGSPVLVSESAEVIVSSSSAEIIRGEALVNAPMSADDFAFTAHDNNGVAGISEAIPDMVYFSDYNSDIKIADVLTLLVHVKAGRVVYFVAYGAFDAYSNDWRPYLMPVQLDRTARDDERDDWALDKTTDDTEPPLVLAQYGTAPYLRWADSTTLGGGEGDPGPAGPSTGNFVLGTPTSNVLATDANFTLGALTKIYGTEPANAVTVANDLGEEIETSRVIRAWAEKTGDTYRMAPLPATLLMVTPTATVASGAANFTANVVKVISGSEHKTQVNVLNTHARAYLATDKLAITRLRGSVDYDVTYTPPKGLLRIRGLADGAYNRGHATMTVDGLVLVGGELPHGTTLPASVTAKIPSFALMDIPDNGEVHLLQDITAGATFSAQWNTGDAANWHWVARGKSGWDPAKKMVLYSEGASETDIEWKEIVSQSVVTSITGVTLTNPTASSLKVQIDYTTRTAGVISVATESADNKNATLIGTVCT